jgi:alkyldihydroxyacetonephosphate synthase
MKRWNGWGEEDIHYSLSSSNIEYLVERIGVGNRSPDAQLEDVLAQVPTSQLSANRLLTADKFERLRHARGQSLPDWIAMRSGRIGVFPDGVAYPETSNDIRELLDFGKEQDLILIPFGGGTSVVGHINPLPGDRLVLTIDMSRLARLKDIDDVSQLATFEAGISGPQVEEQLNSNGYTLGHFPQSFEYSTLGGWVATRSTGQQSYFYGRIEKLVAGVEVETPMGKMSIPPVPASAAGPDLRHIILGSEGILGIITEVTVRVQRIPEVDAFYGIFFRAWQPGIDATRAIAQADIPVSMLRLSDPEETAMSLILGSSRNGLANLAERVLRLLKYREERCLLIFGVTGLAFQTRHSHRHLRSITRRHGGLYAGRIVGNRWRKNRFHAPYLRNALWDQGYAVDTLETAVPWSSVPETVSLLRQAIHEGLKDIGEEVLVFSHLSHVYKDGASIYVTFIFRRSADPEETYQRWLTLKQAPSQVIVSQGGTISHQHGVGTDHAPYLASEKGKLGITTIEAVRQALDPDGMMNPGKLLPDIDVKN